MRSEREVSERLEAAMAAGTPVDEAIRRAGQRAFQYHPWTHTKLWIWRNGRVESIDPNDPNAELPEGFERPPPGPPPWIGL
jgi:hypothetical protein